MENNFTGSSGLKVECAGSRLMHGLLPFEKQ